MSFLGRYVYLQIGQQGGGQGFDLCGKDSPLSFQQKIVRTGVSFLFGKPVQRISDEEGESFSLMDELWIENHLDYLLMIFYEKAQWKLELCWYSLKRVTDRTRLRSRPLFYQVKMGNFTPTMIHTVTCKPSAGILKRFVKIRRKVISMSLLITFVYSS